MKCNFVVGQKIVCVDASAGGRYRPKEWSAPIWFGMDGLTEGAVYTVRAIRPHGPYPYPITVWLAEITRPVDFPWGENGFAPERFRPLVTRKTDISIFTAMLNREPETV